VKTEFVDLGLDTPVPRAEVVVDKGGVERCLHIYEGYWAPYPAGKIGMAAVFKFLVQGALWGIFYCFATFRRFIFGAWQEFPINKKALWALGVTLLVVLSLLLMMTVIMGTLAAIGLHFVMPEGHGWPSTRFTAHVTVGLTAFVLVGGLWAVCEWVAYQRHQFMDDDQQGWAPTKMYRGSSLFLRVLLWLSISAAIGTGLWLAWGATQEIQLAVGVLKPGEGHFFGLHGDGSAWIPAPWSILVWIGAVALYFGARYFLIEYCGDTVCYISAHKVSSHWDVRQRINDAMRGLAAALYQRGVTDQRGSAYDEVLFVGHSLGSMIAYDTLNRLLLDESTGALAGLHVLERTTGLLSFGSGLEKTAFLFRTQAPAKAEIRERIAANRQPLVDDARFRKPLRWVNIYAKEDWVSSKLVFYDPAQPVREWQIDDRLDPYPTIPAVAHVMYWRSPLLARCLLEMVGIPWAPVVPERAQLREAA
jgi:hypothetical protein